MHRKNTVRSAAEDRPNGSEPTLVADNDESALGRVRFGSWLRDRREEIGLAQNELAARAGMTRGLISAYERGRIGVPTANRRRKLADALSVRHIDLLVAAGEITYDELEAGTPRVFTKYPELQRDIEALTPDAADALHDFMYFLVTKPPVAATMRRPERRADWLESYRQARRELVGT